MPEKQIQTKQTIGLWPMLRTDTNQCPTHIEHLLSLVQYLKRNDDYYARELCCYNIKPKLTTTQRALEIIRVMDDYILNSKGDTYLDKIDNALPQSGAGLIIFKEGKGLEGRVKLSAPIIILGEEIKDECFSDGSSDANDQLDEQMKNYPEFIDLMRD